MSVLFKNVTYIELYIDSFTSVVCLSDSVRIALRCEPPCNLCYNTGSKLCHARCQHISAVGSVTLRI